MKYSLSAPSISGSSNPNSDAEEYQVDRLSVSSDGKEDRENEDGGEDIVIAEEDKVPSFGSVSVVNSNYVQFGNKTVYQGPVTIKQFVYPNSVVSSERVSEIKDTSVVAENEDIIACNGIDNPAFVKEKSSLNGNIDKPALDNNNDDNQLPTIWKGILWLQNLPRERPKGLAILLAGLIVSVTILTGVIIWRQTPVIVQDVIPSDTNEQDNNTPIDYHSDSNSTINEKVRIVSRLQWLAQPPIHPADPLKTPVSLVIIQHTATESCSSQAQCIFHVRHIQTYHIESNHWWDIAYNFLVGGDGAVYEGRGWQAEGSHTYGYNSRSIGVGFIGTFISQVPPPNQIAAFHKLLAKGVELGYLKADYKILGARQVHATESPGEAFFKEMKTWSHWSAVP